jgi:regulatory protein
MFNRPREDDEDQPRRPLTIKMLNDPTDQPVEKKPRARPAPVERPRAPSFTAPKAIKPPKERAAPSSRPANAPRREKPMTASRIRNISEFQLSQRDYTAEMMRSMLNRRAFSWLRSVDEDERAEVEATFHADVEARIKELVDAGLIDDARYARQKARSMRLSGKGARRIQMELMKKGVNEHIVADAIAEVDAETLDLDDEDTTAVESERAAAETLAQKKKIGPYRRKPMPDDHAGRTKMWRREAGVLSRAGYGLDIIREILDREPEEDTDW